jgi:hypothetical protein
VLGWACRAAVVAPAVGGALTAGSVMWVLPAGPAWIGGGLACFQAGADDIKVSRARCGPAPLDTTLLPPVLPHGAPHLYCSLWMPSTSWELTRLCPSASST